MPCAWWHSSQIYHCQRPVTNGDNDLLHRSTYCDVGCFPCDDYVGAGAMRRLIGASNQGRRWARPSLVSESRDAYGRYHFMNSAEPWMLSPGAAFELALVYVHPGAELFNQTVCNGAAYGYCLSGQGNDVVNFPLSTCFWAPGAAWTPAPLVYPLCTSHQETYPPPSVIHIVFAGDDPDFEGGGTPAAFVRTWHRGEGWQPQLNVLQTKGVHLRSWCTANMNVLCCGQIPNYNDCVGNANTGSASYYMDLTASGNAWGIWDFARIIEFNGQFGDHATLDHDRAAIDAKNAALAFVGSDIAEGANSVMDLEQLSSWRRFGGFEVNLNQYLNYFAAEWTAPEGQAIAVHSLPNSFLRKAGCAVTADYVITKARIELSLINYRERTFTHADMSSTDFPDEKVKRTLPIARINVVLEMGVRATLAEPCDAVIVGGGEAASPFPSVEGDRIVYVDALGRGLLLPARVNWRGNLGAFSDPPTADIYSHEYTAACGDGGNDTDLNECCALAHGLRDLFIPPWPSHPDSSLASPNYLWEGGMRIQFPNFNLHCLLANGQGSPCVAAI